MVGLLQNEEVKAPVCFVSVSVFVFASPPLLQDLVGFNRFFMDKEEDAVIKLQALADRIQAAQGDTDAGSQEKQELKAALVDFHGESRQHVL